MMRLVKKGLVKKVVCKSDRRLVDVSITDKGMKLLERMDELQPQLDGIVESLQESEARQLNKLLDKIRNSE